MIFNRTRLPGVILVEPAVHGDARGFFVETYHERRYVENGITKHFVQDNHSKSKRGTLRGLHAQLKNPQGKLVRAVEGEILDVAVDVRRGSPTFGQWVAEKLSAENFRQLWVPEGFVHGFCVLSPWAQVEYKVTAFYDREDEFGVAWNDPDLGIDWPVKEPLLSDRDRAAPRLRDVEELPVYEAK
jgi:dTDP-4-dehydrorhamnose 3,5-epimerase